MLFNKLSQQVDQHKWAVHVVVHPALWWDHAKNVICSNEGGDVKVLSFFPIFLISSVFCVKDAAHQGVQLSRGCCKARRRGGEEGGRGEEEREKRQDGPVQHEPGLLPHPHGRHERQLLYLKPEQLAWSIEEREGESTRELLESLVFWPDRDRRVCVITKVIRVGICTWCWAIVGVTAIVNICAPAATTRAAVTPALRNNFPTLLQGTHSLPSSKLF